MKKSTKPAASLASADMAQLEFAAAVAKCLSNPKRFGIIEALSQAERTVGDLARHLDIASQVVSVELRIMKELGAVSARRQHPEVYYRLSDPRLAEAARLVRAIAETRLDAGHDIPLTPSRKKQSA